MLRNFILLAILCQSACAARLPLDAGGDRVRTSNPDLAAARLRIEEARGRLMSAGKRSNPEVESELAHDTKTSEGGLVVGFTQKFPVTARLRLEKEVSATELAAAEAEAADAERKFIAEAEAAVVTAMSLSEMKLLRNKQVEVAAAWAAFTTKAAASGEVSAVQAGQARLDQAITALEVRRMDSQLAEAHARVRLLLGIPAAEDLKIVGSLPAPLVPSVPSNKPDGRPDYQAARLSASAAERAIALEKAKAKDDISAGFFISAQNEIDAPNGAERNYGAGVRISIPLRLWNKNEGAIHEKKATYERLEKEADALGLRIQNDIQANRAVMTELAGLLSETTDNLLPLAKEQAERAEAAVKAGQGELQDLLRARDQQFEVETARLEALRDFHLARVQLKAALGNAKASPSIKCKN